MQSRIFVIGMHLNGEIRLCVDKLDEKRKTFTVPSLADSVLICCKIVGKRLAVVCTADNRIYTVSAACQLPRFRDFFTRFTLAVFTGKTFAAPNNFFRNCAELYKFDILNFPFIKVIFRFKSI